MTFKLLTQLKKQVIIFLVNFLNFEVYRDDETQSLYIYKQTKL